MYYDQQGSIQRRKIEISEKPERGVTKPDVEGIPCFHLTGTPRQTVCGHDRPVTSSGMSMSLPSHSTDSDRQSRTVKRILDQMDRIALRADPQYSRQRQHERKTYRGPLSLFVPTTDSESPPHDLSGCVEGWSYSLSQGGVGLIARENIESPTMWVGVHLPHGSVRWLHGKIVRRRAIPDEQYFEYGVAFGVAPAAGQPANEGQTADLPAEQLNPA